MKKVLLLAVVLCGLCKADAQHLKNQLKRGIKYQSEINVGYGAAKHSENYPKIPEELIISNYFIFETVQGFRISPHFFTGIGAKMLAKTNFDAAHLPIFADVKYYPINRVFAPYIAVDIGYSISLYSNYRYGSFYDPDCFSYNGIHGMVGAGFNYKHLNFGLGYQIQHIKSWLDSSELSNKQKWPSSFNLKVGVKF